MRSKPLRALALALAAGGLLALFVLPAQARRRPAPVTVTAALAALQRAGQLSAAEYNRYESAYVAARRSYGRLAGTRRSELGGVLANVQAMAATGAFVPSRLPALFLTLERNRAWWTTGPLLGAHARVSVPGSRLVWEYYPGQGIEIQWLGTFGEANGYFLSGHENTAFRELMAEVIPLATKRAGGIAWEYMFQFDGGLPPWTSGLSQGTALQALSRGYQRMHDQAYLTAAQEALGIFQVAPPVGVRVATPAGAEYAEYTYAPADHILNGFVQALVGLYDYTQIVQDPLGQQLFEAGDAEARAETPHYDTGGWSRYDQHEESDLSYHELLAEFLLHLCERTQKGSPLAPAPAPKAPPNPAIPGDDIYCATAQRFTADIHTPPALALLTKSVRGGTRAGVQFSLSKVSAVSMTVSLAGHTVWTNSATVEGGRPRLLWVTPTKAGVYTVAIGATDLAGNHAAISGTIAVKKGSRQ
ncbi:MAG TPA: D-glucuronyl C5-epimerase family protein [Solirubrobacteraceae bacterium]